MEGRREEQLRQKSNNPNLKDDEKMKKNKKKIHNILFFRGGAERLVEKRPGGTALFFGEGDPPWSSPQLLTATEVWHFAQRAKGAKRGRAEKRNKRV